MSRNPFPLKRGRSPTPACPPARNAEQGLHFVISRKIFLFAKTPGGARCSASLFCLIETAKENGFDLYRYLTWVLAEAPKRAAAESPAWAEKLATQYAPPQCRAISDN